ncbi:unnamed protein product [Mycena citricolor]|uniref:T6SS Phospholipase effector Tle1-like catalytic domain-containing protein n=1 Tax=Mycena citricolor TaxID=2018698 RepID=A0AAD2HZS7_9AGAR|nr:unnamed protein product [Mycena citricolor]
MAPAMSASSIQVLSTSSIVKIEVEERDVRPGFGTARTLVPPPLLPPGSATGSSFYACDTPTVSRWVPPPENTAAREGRCLILAFDGTGDQFDSDNSNIVQLVSALKKNDKSKQMVYYQSGIGTYTTRKFATPFATTLSLTLDAMIAWNLDDHVMAGYEFLMQNYSENDRICIFGFSRGAYIARSLAGMLHKVGLLSADNHQQVPFAYRMYTRTDEVGWAQSNAFKKAFSSDVHIEFIGVWDTVDSVGLIPHRLPFTTSNTIVKTFRHAVSLDEHRAKFKANLWNVPTSDEATLGLHTPPTPTVLLPSRPPKHAYTLPLPSLGMRALHFRSSTEPKVAKDDDKDSIDEGDLAENFEQERFEREFTLRHPHLRRKESDVLEVWFAGCHCDVGGGSVPNDTRNSLARIPLRWMIRECFKADTGIIFDTSRLQELGLDPSTLYPYVLERPPALHLPEGPDGRIQQRQKLPSLRKRLFGRKAKLAIPAGVVPDVPSPTSTEEGTTVHRGMEEEEELRDLLSPVYDQLKIQKGWWLLECLPFSFRYQKRDQKWVTEFRSNFGRARHIPHQIPHDPVPKSPDYFDHKPPTNLKVHRSVRTRLMASDAKGRRYVQRALFECEPEWVD